MTGPAPTLRLACAPSLLLVAAAAALGGCDDSSARPAAPSARADGVTTTRATGSRATGPTAPASASQARTAPRPPRKLCQGQSKREAPVAIGTSRHAKGTKELPPLGYGQGRWLWLNLWAGWCKPCKAEMPMLLTWRDKLSAAGARLELAFVSVDEDEREMMRFLSSQPSRGVRASYWVEGEDEQEKLFTSLGFEDTPQLPIHGFISPDGKLACVVKGALEKGDYPALAKLFGAGG